MFGIVGLSSAMVQGGLIGPITKLIGKKRILVLGSFLIMVTLALIPYAGNFLWLAVVGIFLSLGTGILQPTLLSLISEVTSDAEQGITLGVNQSLSALARMLGPLWGGFAFEFLGYPFPFLTGAAFMFLIVIATIFYIPRRIKF
jgi:DHA1 family tetracycline resistance protein-like MFS transporter